CQPLCDPCIVYADTRPHCFLCARTIKQRARITNIAKLAGAVAALGVTFALAAWWPRPFDYGADAPHIRELRERAGADRCDQAATLAYDEAMLRAGDARGALADSDDYLARCGDWYRLRWVRYGAHEQRGEELGAADEATRLMAHDPN